MQTSSARDAIYYSAATPQVLQVGGVDLTPSNHCLIPWMRHAQEGRQAPSAVTGVEHNGIEWISVNHFASCGNKKLRLIYNALGFWLKPWGNYIKTEDVLESIAINDGDLVLNAPPPGIGVAIEGLYLPPGSLQILMNGDCQVVNHYTTLPTTSAVRRSPCLGWCQKQHIYTDFGMVEKAVVFFNDLGWPIACRESNFEGEDSRSTWWRFDYSRPTPTQEVAR